MSDSSGERTPHSRKAEMAVLGAVLKNPDVLIELGSILEPEHFYLEQHRLIYRGLLELDEAKKPIDLVIVCGHLADRGLLDEAGGAVYINQLIDHVPSTVRYEEYGNIVLEKATRRNLIAMARSSVQQALDESTEIGQVTDGVAQEFLNLAAGSAQSHTREMRDVLSDVYEKVRELAGKTMETGLTGVTSGFYALDKMTAGWQPSDLVILAARPGMGKTAFALNLLANAASSKDNPRAAVFFSLEMSSEQLVFRVISSESGVPLKNLRTGQLSKTEQDTFFNSYNDLARLPIFIHDRAPITVTEVSRICRKLHHEHDLGLVVIDYLQLMQGSTLRKGQNREQEISEISRNLKALAKELKVPIIALSQLNRAVESRTPPIPQLSDLRESGAIEQDADMIIFLFRQAYYDAIKGKDESGDAESIALEKRRMLGGDETEIIIAKHRSGSTGKVNVLFIPERTAFANMGSDVPIADDSAFGPEAARERNSAPPSSAPVDPMAGLREPGPEPDGTAPPGAPQSWGEPPPAAPSSTFDAFDFDDAGFAELDDDDDDLPL